MFALYIRGSALVKGPMAGLGRQSPTVELVFYLYSHSRENVKELCERVESNHR
jgi:hypothetical protein